MFALGKSEFSQYLADFFFFVRNKIFFPLFSVCKAQLKAHSPQTELTVLLRVLTFKASQFHEEQNNLRLLQLDSSH